MRKKGSWNTRKVTITAIFGLSLLYGANELLRGGSAPVRSPRSVGNPETVHAHTVSATALDAVQADRAPAVRPTGPSRETIAEAQRLRERGWEGVDPFAGKSWRGAPEVAPEPKAPKVDPVLRATSRSADGWRAVVDDEVIKVGDKILGGRVVSISEGKVVVRGVNWEKILRFAQERGR